MNKRKKPIQNPEDAWIDVHDDALMVSLGLRAPALAPKDPAIWTKTEEEKELLKRYRGLDYGNMRCSFVPSKSIPVYAKLIIHLKKNDKFKNTTYSTMCWQHQIPAILSHYRARFGDAEYNVVSKYSYNGKTYKFRELPFWY